MSMQMKSLLANVEALTNGMTDKDLSDLTYQINYKYLDQEPDKVQQIFIDEMFSDRYEDWLSDMRGDSKFFFKTELSYRTLVSNVQQILHTICYFRFKAKCDG